MSTNVRLLLIFFSIVLSVFIILKIPLKKGLDLQGGIRLTLQATPDEGEIVTNEDVSGVIHVVRGRIDGLGLSEPTIARKGSSQIIVEMPGVQDLDRAVSLIGETALLTFWTAEWGPPGIKQLSPEKFRLLSGDSAKIVYIERNGESYPLILRKKVMSGSDLKSTYPGSNELGKPIVNIEFTSEGANKFFDITSKNVGKPLAILLDDKVVSAPNINEAIAGGRAQISGEFTPLEVKDLVIKLKAGALPVPIKIISNKLVGPTLGENSIARSQKAFIIGFISVCIYMLIAYRLLGLIAGLALFMYMLFFLASLKFLMATLTLPGIAGCILTMGMAVDANVIIFERIKEEYASSGSMKLSIKNGFSRAIETIIDSNITTLFASIVLFLLGSGSIKGFAITLTLGVLLSMYSSILVTGFLVSTFTKLFKSDSLYLDTKKYQLNVRNAENNG